MTNLKKRSKNWARKSNTLMI